MPPAPHSSNIQERFTALFGRHPEVVASAPGRLEVLGNHTDYNAGLTLSCAANHRCDAALIRLEGSSAMLASTAFGSRVETFPIAAPLAIAREGHWVNYILGIVSGLQTRGHSVPGFAVLVDSDIPQSAGLSSSAALEMAVLTGLAQLMQLDLAPIELARIGQWAECQVVGAETGLLDQLTSLCGKRDCLLHTDFRSLGHRTIPFPAGWAFVAVDSGVKHNLALGYNDRRSSCEAAASAMRIQSLRDATPDLLERFRAVMADYAYSCAQHILDENLRVDQAVQALADQDMGCFGRLMFESHRSSRYCFRNSCPELDRRIDFAESDRRCLGARLSGGGFGGITIHLTRVEDAESYREAICHTMSSQGSPIQQPWSTICTIDRGASVEVVQN